MRKYFKGVFLFLAPTLFAILFLFWSPGEITGASQTARDLNRRYDVIKVRGDFLRPFQGTRINNLALLASKGGKTVPIPFQVDERDRKGRYIMTQGKTARSDDDNGALDSNDELFFMISDAGNRLPEADRKDKIEIELTDPRYPGKHAWAYLARYDSGNPPRSTVDYVDYNPETEQIVSKNYILGYKKGHMFYNDLIYPKSAGGNGEDFFDRIKFRIKVEFIRGKVINFRNEDSIKASVKGWIDGPVRVVQATVNHVKLLEVLPPISFNSMSEYYPNMMASPITVKFPFDLNSAMRTFGIRTIIMDIIGDMPGLVGGNSYTNLNPEGYVYTGKATPEILDKVPKKGLVWGFATKAGVGTWFPRLVFPDLMYQFNYFYITDNISYENPPDDVPGEIGAGLRLDLGGYPIGLIKLLAQESFMLKFETYFAPPGLTPDEAREWLDIQDYPVMVNARGGPPVDPSKLSGKKSTKPPWKGGRNGTITDVLENDVQLSNIVFFIGGVDVHARTFFFGERVSDQSFRAVHISKFRSLTNYTVEYEPITKTRMAMFSKLEMNDGSTLDLMSCRSCGWGGTDDSGRVIYLTNSQIKKIEFAPGK